MFKYIISIFFFLVGNVLVIGQNKENITKAKTQDESYLSADLYFISDAVFMGRKDSITAPYLYPLITYHHKSGLYARGSFSYLTKSEESRIDLFLATVGYDFTVKKLNGDISLTKYFFNDDSYNVISQVTADITANLTYDFDILNLALSGSTFFNKESSSDFILSSEVSHDFVTSNNKFQISPSIGINMGSQNFYDEYYINKQIGGGGGNGFGNNSGGTTTTITTVSVQEGEKFNLLSVDFSLPIWYSNKSLTLLFLPTYVIPQNASTFVVDDVVVEEDLENTFYWMAGFSFRF